MYLPYTTAALGMITQMLVVVVIFFLLTSKISENLLTLLKLAKKRFSNNAKISLRIFVNGTLMQIKKF